MFQILTVLTGVVAVAANAASAAIAQTDPNPDPYTLFAKARTYWEAQRYPAILDYRVTVDVDEGDSEKVQHYTSEVDETTGKINVDPISDYQMQHPASPHGVNLSVLLPMGKPPSPVDYMGVPELSPAYSFGVSTRPPQVASTKMTDAQIIAQIRAEFHDPNPRGTATASPDPADATGQHEIIRVVAVAHDYAMTYDGTETIDGHACYKIKLNPTREPHRFRLRELWIDQQTSATWQAQVVLNFERGPGTEAPWLIHFQDVNGAHYISTEVALDQMNWDDLVYKHATVSFDQIHTVAVPDVHEQIFVHNNSTDADPLYLTEP